MKKLIGSDYFFIVLIVFLISICLYGYNNRIDINKNGIISVAKVVSIEKVYNQGVFIEYEFTYEGKIYLNRQSVESRKMAQKYLNNYYEVKFLTDTPDKSLIDFEKKIIKPNTK